MKNQKKCKVCSKRFESVRSDAKYCSNACKQKAHTQKDKKVEQPHRIFSIEEYSYLSERWGVDGEQFPFIFFCFLRAKLPDSVNRASLEVYFDSVWNRNNFEDLISSDAFKYFQEAFLKRSNVIEVNNI